LEKHLINIQEITERDTRANDVAKTSEIGVKMQLKSFKK
jgi:hypothetical protein